MKKLFQSGLLAFLCVLCASVAMLGCAGLQAGADPVVVRTEQFLTGAQGTFRYTLQVDDLDRGYWRSKAPAFHEYCEVLRTPTVYQETNTLPQYRVALLALNDLKNDYKRGRASSNAVLTALAVVEGLNNQAGAWLAIITNRAH